MTLLQRYSNVDSTYSSAIIIFVLHCIIKKLHLNRYVSAVRYHFTLPNRQLISAGIMFYVYF